MKKVVKIEPKFKVGDLVCHKYTDLGIGEVKKVCEDGRFAVDFGAMGRYLLNDDVLEGFGDFIGPDPDDEYVGKVECCEAPGDAPADVVNHPAHYTAGKVECIDALEAATTGLSGIEAVCTANAIKYLWRWKRKNGTEDLQKAIWYIEHLVEHEQGGATGEQVHESV